VWAKRRSRYARAGRTLAVTCRGARLMEATVRKEVGDARPRRATGEGLADCQLRPEHSPYATPQALVLPLVTGRRPATLRGPALGEQFQLSPTHPGASAPGAHSGRHDRQIIATLRHLFVALHSGHERQVEHFITTASLERAHARLYPYSNERRRALAQWLHQRRPHGPTVS
jgi:hypothetical protein